MNPLKFSFRLKTKLKEKFASNTKRKGQFYTFISAKISAITLPVLVSYFNENKNKGTRYLLKMNKILVSSVFSF